MTRPSAVKRRRPFIWVDDTIAWSRIGVGIGPQALFTHLAASAWLHQQGHPPYLPTCWYDDFRVFQQVGDAELERLIKYGVWEPVDGGWRVSDWGVKFPSPYRAGTAMTVIAGPVDGLDCAYCPAPAGSWDHVIPVSRGGTDDRENLVPACIRCNTSKHAKTPEEWWDRTNPGEPFPLDWPRAGVIGALNEA
jgi:hypothetical protein